MRRAGYIGTGIQYCEVSTHVKPARPQDKINITKRMNFLVHFCIHMKTAVIKINFYFS